MVSWSAEGITRTEPGGADVNEVRPAFKRRKIVASENKLMIDRLREKA